MLTTMKAEHGVVEEVANRELDVLQELEKHVQYVELHVKTTLFDCFPAIDEMTSFMNHLL